MGLKTLALPSILGVYHDKTLRWFDLMRTQSVLGVQSELLWCVFHESNQVNGIQTGKEPIEVPGKKCVVLPAA